MSLDNENTKNRYEGNDSSDTFPYSFKIFSESDLLVTEFDDKGDEAELVLNTDYTVTGVGSGDGGSIVRSAGNLPEDYVLIIERARPFTQTTKIRNQSEYYASIHEDTFDKITMLLQQLNARLLRAFKLAKSTDLSVFDPTLPAILDEYGGKLIRIKSDMSGLEWVDADVAFAESGDGGSLPPGGEDGAVLAKASADTLDVEWLQYAFSGFSSRFNEQFESTDLMDTLTKIIKITYTAPTISLSASGSGTIREKGDEVTASTLTASITKKSDPINEVRFYQGATLLDTQTSGGAIPNGGSSTYSWSGSFSDNTTFKAEVDDDGTTGGPTTVSDTVSFTFVYPYYVGAGDADLSASGVAALTKRIIASTSSREETITVGSGEYTYFAYLKSYGALTSILDENGFEVIDAWTEREVDITGLDSTTQTYYVYEGNNSLEAGDYGFTFKR